MSEVKTANKSGLATAGLVLGIIGIVLSFIPIINNIAFVLGILALIFGIISLIKHASKGKAIAGLVLGILSIVITIGMQSAVSDAIDKTTNELNINAKSAACQYTYNQHCRDNPFPVSAKKAFSFL